MIAPSAQCAPSSCLEKKQIIHRMPPRFVLRILADFNDGAIDASTAQDILVSVNSASMSCGATTLSILQMEISRQNRTRQRSTGLIPLEVWETALLENKAHLRPAPPSSLLDLHLSLRAMRRVNNDQTIDFEGKNYEIATTARKSVAIIHHPNRRFWVLEQIPKNVWPCVLGSFSL
ncbi:MAG: hypothetical protein WCH98_10620 [Verrucomicrobiota bacterium]